MSARHQNNKKLTSQQPARENILGLSSCHSQAPKHCPVSSSIIHHRKIPAEIYVPAKDLLRLLRELLLFCVELDKVEQVSVQT